MEEHTFPPAANWYRSKILDCAEDGTLAYGTRNHIVVIKLNQNTEKTPFKFYVLYNAHREKINAVAFSPSTNSNDKYLNWLCSASDDSQVKVWDIETQTPVMVNCTHGEGQKINCVDWSKVDPNLIVSIDDSNKIVLWDIFSNTTRHLIISKMNAVIVACCPHDRSIIAVGSASGLVYIINTKGKVLHRLRGHDTEVTSLAWCPVPYNVLQPPEKRTNNELLLASAAKDKLVYVWKAVGDGCYDSVLAIPTQPLSAGSAYRSKMGANSGSSVNWICLAWPEASTILISSPFGELLKADLNVLISTKLKTSKLDRSINRMWKLVHAEHNRGIFSIASTPKYWTSLNKDAEVKNGKTELETISASNGNEECIADKSANAIKNGNAHTASERKKLIWTTAHDMQLIAYDWCSEKASIFSVNGGYAYCIAISPLDASRFAFGLGDGTIRIWSVGAQNKFRTTSLWQKIGGKVMALAWHPQIEGLLAFGTSEGRVGLCYTLTGKPPVIFRTRHHCVYRLCWAPPLNQKVQESSEPETKFHLFACSHGELLQYNPNAPEEDPFSLKEVLKASNLNSKKETRRSDSAWKPDYKYVAVGNEDGTVQIYSLPDLKLRQTLLAHKKLVQCLIWHPESTAVDSGYSPYRNWLATSSNESSIKVYDITNLVENEDYLENEGSLKTYSLLGHSGRVVCMSWNPHIGGQLISASYDGTARIWNVPAQEAIAVLNEQCGCILSCAWSPLNPDLVLTGSSDFTVYVWSVSNQKNSPVEKRKAKKLSGSKIAKPPAEVDKGKQSIGNNRSSDTKNLQASRTKESSSAEYNAVKSDAPEAEELQGEIGEKKKSSKAFFPLSFFKDRELENCYRLLEALDKKNTADELNTENQAGLLNDQVSEDVSNEQELSVVNVLFQDRKAMHKLIDLEVAELTKRKRSDQKHQMLMWKGNVTEMLREAARTKTLNDWLVSLAPMASQKVWLEMCSAYAEQLAIHGNYHKASSYLLACHKVDEAIELLASNNFYREAVVIAKCRLGPEDPAVNNLVSNWAFDEQINGNYEAAASCYIYLGRLPEAVKCLRRRRDPLSLKCGAFIARKAEMNNVAAELANNSMCQCLLNGEFDLAAQIAEEHPELKHLKLLLSAHRKTMELVYLNEGPKTFAEYVAWIKGNTNNTSVPLLQLIIEQWNTDLYKDNLEQIYAILEKELGISETVESREKLWLAVSRGLTLACLSSDERRYHHICSVLSTCYHYIMLHPKEQYFLLCLCMWLSPQGPSAAGSIFSPTDSDEQPNRIFRSLRAYLCAALLDWLTKYFENKNERLLDSGYARECPNAEADAEQWIIPLEFLKSCRDDIMSLECVQYFQDCVKIKKLERDVAAYIAKAKQSSALSETSVPDPERNDNELPQTSVPDPERNDNELPQTSVLDSEMNENELPQTDVPDVERDENEPPQTSVADAERKDTELPQTSVPDAERKDTELPQTSVPDTVKNHNGLHQTEEKDSNNVLKIFKELKMRKENFEHLYISSPNPFITYCKLKAVLERAAEYQCLLANNLLSDFELCWKHIMEVTSVS